MHGFDLRKPESINELQTLILAGGFGLVMIDALCNVMIGGDENSVKDTQIIFQNLRRLSDCTGASFVIAHHTNKAGDYRGSTAIPGGVDSMLLIKSDEGSEYINFESGKLGGAPLVRLELTTIGLEVRCSVQLSYRGIFRFCPLRISVTLIDRARKSVYSNMTQKTAQTEFLGSES